MKSQSVANQLTKPPKRERSVDFIRGFTIALVIFGHCIQCGSGDRFFASNSFYENWCFRIIYSFHMPLFSWISGYCFLWSLQKGEKHILSHVVKSLILPMAFWSPIYTLLNKLINNSFASSNFLHDTFNTFTNNFWFIWGIAFCTLLLCVTLKLFSGKYIKIALIFECLATLFAFRHFMFYQYAFLYPFFVIGYYFHKRRNIITTKWITNKRALAGWTSIYLLLIPFYNNDSYIYVSFLSILRGPNPLKKQLLIDIYRYIIGISGTMTIYYASCTICNARQNKIIDRIANLFSHIGNQTLCYYIISGFLTSKLLTIFPNAYPSAILWIFEFIVIMSICEGVTYLIRNNKVLRLTLAGGR